MLSPCCCLVLDTEEKEVVGSLRLELASVNRQLTQSREEADNLKMTSSKEIRSIH